MAKSNQVQCPLVDRKIKDIECIENSDVVKGIQIETTIPEEYKKKKDWKEICKKCQWHNY